MYGGSGISPTESNSTSVSIVGQQFDHERVAGFGSFADPHRRAPVNGQDLADLQALAGAQEGLPGPSVVGARLEQQHLGCSPLSCCSRRRAGITFVSFSTSRSPSRSSSAGRRRVGVRTRRLGRRAVERCRGSMASQRSARPAARSRSRRSGPPAGYGPDLSRRGRGCRVPGGVGAGRCVRTPRRAPPGHGACGRSSLG